MSTLIIHHNNDHDGVMSAYLLGRKFPDAKFFGYDYEPYLGEKMLAEAARADRIFIVDLGQRPGLPTWAVIQRYGPKTTVIDHHKSTIDLANRIKAYGAGFYGRTDRSSIGLVSEYTDQPLGPVLKNLELYDMKGAPGYPIDVEFYVRNLRPDNWKDPTSEFARHVFSLDRKIKDTKDKEFARIQQTGRSLVEATKKQLKQQILANPIEEATWRGKKLIITPVKVPGPMAKEIAEELGLVRGTEYLAVDDPNRDTMVVYSIRPGASVLDMVKEMGGGGHMFAGGCDKNTFYKNVKLKGPISKPGLTAEVSSI